jgi:hypothetical protein
MKNKTSLHRHYYLLFCFLLCACNASVESGQTWVKAYSVENPFENTTYDTLFILKVHGDWMQYRKGERIYSDRKSLLNYNAKRIK